MGFRGGPPSRALSLVAIAILLAIIALPVVIGGEPFGPCNPPPEPFTDFALRPAEMLPTSEGLPAGADIEDLGVAVGPDGAVHAVWLEPVDGKGAVMYSKRWPGRASFDPAQRLSNTSNDCSEPRMAISGNGTVHVVWVAVVWGSGEHVMLARSFPDRGWFDVRVIWDYNRPEGLSFGVAPDGTVYLTYTYWEMAELAGRGFLTTWHTGCELLRWNDSMGWPELHRVYHESDTANLLPARASLTISAAGNPHIVVESQGYISWYRSLDGGSTWERGGDWFDGPVHPVDFRAAALEDERIAIAYTTSPDRNWPSWPYHDLGHSIGLLVSDPAGMSSTQNLTRMKITTVNQLPTAFDIHLTKDGLWLACLGFPKEKGGEPNINGSVTPRLYAYGWTEGGGAAGPVEIASVPGAPELDPALAGDGLGEAVLALDLEADGRPVVGAACPLRSEEPVRGFVWRVNHAPVFPDPLSETEGGWVFDNPLELIVNRSFDLDGDPVEYRFLIVYRWGSFYLEQVTDGPGARFHLPGNGDFCWTVWVSDQWATVGTDEDWWFRFDLAPPRADAGGPYACDEGETVLLNGSGSRDERPLTLWEWDLDGDGTFEVSSESAFYEHATTDDTETRISLRVTDIAGRTDVDHTILVVRNVDPVATLSGPTSVPFDVAAQYQVEVTDQGVEDTHTVTWLVDGVAVGGGTSLSYVFESTGVHVVTAVVHDDDGGRCELGMNVEVLWVDAPYLVFEVPDEVMQGEPFRVYVSQHDLNPFTEWEFQWAIDGEAVSDGLEAWCLVDEPGEVTVAFSAESADGTYVIDEWSVLVRERLLPVTMLGVTGMSIDHLVVEWTRCRQGRLFEGYEVFVFGEPVAPWDPVGTSDPPSGLVGRHLVEDIGTTTYTLADLVENTTYHIYVDVLGDGQRAHSNVLSVRTMAELPGPPTPDPQPDPSNGNGGDGGEGADGEDGTVRVHPAQLVVLVIVVVAVSLLMAYLYVRYRG